MSLNDELRKLPVTLASAQTFRKPIFSANDTQSNESALLCSRL